MTMGQSYQLSHYLWSVPDELIATEPSHKRGGSRLMVINRQTGKIQHQQFSDIIDILQAGDLLVANQTKVAACRLQMIWKDAKSVDVLFVAAQQGSSSASTWHVLCKGVQPGDQLSFQDCTGIAKQRLADDSLQLQLPVNQQTVNQWFEQQGSMPLPPYILKQRKKTGKHEDEYKATDRQRYQTVYASEATKRLSIAAPTAGLHFSQDIIDRLQQKGIQLEKLELQVGSGTFKPIVCDDIRQHQMASEAYAIPANLMAKARRLRQQNRRLIAVGTTSVRALESAWRSGVLEGESDLFIYPGKDEKPAIGSIDGLLTNFHLPGSTLLLLVVAFAGEDLIREAYKEAVANEYHFYSYGDAMLIL